MLLWNTKLTFRLIAETSINSFTQISHLRYGCKSYYGVCVSAPHIWLVSLQYIDHTYVEIGSSTNPTTSINFSISFPSLSPWLKHFFTLFVVWISCLQYYWLCSLYMYMCIYYIIYIFFISIPYHTTPHHSIPYHTIPYHSIPLSYQCSQGIWPVPLSYSHSSLLIFLSFLHALYISMM